MTAPTVQYLQAEYKILVRNIDTLRASHARAHAMRDPSNPDSYIRALEHQSQAVESFLIAFDSLAAARARTPT